MPEQHDDESRSTTASTGVTGLILAGGKSSRYGVNKALVAVEGITLIEHAVRVMKDVFQDVIILTNTPAEYAFLNLPMVEDVIKGLGPIGGIYTGLRTISGEAGFFVACDMPFLNKELLRHMLEVRGGFDAVVPRVGWMIEPLHAIYTKGCLPVIKAMIDSRKYQILQCLNNIRVRYVEEEELRGFDPELHSFFNINEPGDLQRTLSSPALAALLRRSGGDGDGGR